MAKMDGPLFEYACHEDSVAMIGILKHIAVRRSRATLFLLCFALIFASAPAAADEWIATWATATVAQGAPDARASRMPSVGSIKNQTLRQIVRASADGTRVRVVVTNAFGTAPLMVGAAGVALRKTGAEIIGDSVRALTFGGLRSIRVPAGAIALSDPVALAVDPLAEIAVDVYFPDELRAGTSPLTVHTAALQTNYLSGPGNHTGAAALPVAAQTPSWYFLDRVEVEVAERRKVVVALGDSITDGSGSTADTNTRWPDFLAQMLITREPAAAVLNLGIGGNRLLIGGLGDAILARLDRDVLVQTGVTDVVVLVGINDIGLARNELGLPRYDPPPTAADLIAAYKQVIARVHAAGLRVFGGTLTPFADAAVPNYWSPEGEATRQAVNTWIRTGGGFDAVIDFDAILRDPTTPSRLRAAYDSGDHLHPNSEAYKAMGAAAYKALSDHAPVAGSRR